jgi:hypothetical protein
MKRKTGLALVVFQMVFGICFVQGFEIGGSVFIASSDVLSISGGGLNIAGTGYFTDTIGYGIYGNILYGTYEDITIIPIDMLIGLAFKAVQNDKFTLPIAAGIYMVNSFAYGGGVAIEGFNIGFGANISAEIKLAGNTHFFLRLQGAFEFGGEVILTPSIGIGWSGGGGGRTSSGGGGRRR